MGSYTYSECDSCGQQAGGYSKTELEKQGWVWHEVKQGYTTKATFVMCDECECEYSKRWELRRMVAA